MKTWIAAFAFLLGSAGAASAMSISFDWGPTKKCFDAKSPPISLSGLPEGTAKLRIRMTDLDATSFNHGGGTIAYSGQKKLPYGAFSYKGPCPPTAHTYQFTVDALDSKGKKLASAKARRRFP